MPILKWKSCNLMILFEFCNDASLKRNATCTGGAKISSQEGQD